MAAKRVIIITGQTATGKTELALDLAKKNNGELINADARQIYTQLDIITGKDKNKIESKVWMYDVVDPKEYFSSYDYKEKTLPIINTLLQQEKTPIIIGGSYLYIKHLLYEIETEHIPPDWPLRKMLEHKTTVELQKKLESIDKKTYNSLNQSDRNNPQRLIRKIEIASFEHDKKHKTKPTPGLYERPDIEVQFFGLRFKKKDQLKIRIQERVAKRLQQGAVEEVQSLLQKGYTAHDPGMKTIGYQQIIRFLERKSSLDEAVFEWTTREIQYSKRQLTFMKKDKNIVWKEV